MRQAPKTIAIFLIVASSILALLNIYVYGTISSALSLPYLSLPFIVFPIGLFVSEGISRIWGYCWWNRIIYTISVFWVAPLLQLAVASVVYQVLVLVSGALPIAQYFMYGAIGSVTIACLYGIYNALHPQIKKYTIVAPSLAPLWSGKTIAVISDVHLGLVRNKQFMHSIVEKLQTLSPDIIFIAGDLIDGPHFPYEESLQHLAMLKPPLGIYYAAGNHDEYNTEQSTYYTSLTKYVTVLNTKRTSVNGTQIIGLDYAIESSASAQERLLSTSFVSSQPSIVLLHDPKNSPALAEKGVSLTISGHTHAGQFFPFTLVVRSLYKTLTRGVSYLGEMAQFTSVGIGTAGPLLRLGMTPEIAVLQITEK